MFTWFDSNHCYKKIAYNIFDFNKTFMYVCDNINIFIIHQVYLSLWFYYSELGDLIQN